MNPLTREWLAKAEEDYHLVITLLRRKKLPANSICFHAQQAAEKYLKAVLQERQTRFGRTHDLIALLELLGADAGSLPLLADDLRHLSGFAVISRYPGFNAVAKEARDASAAMKRIRAAAMALFI
jgi:HEPN domain-containing protein